MVYMYTYIYEISNPNPNWQTIVSIIMSGTSLTLNILSHQYIMNEVEVEPQVRVRVGARIRVRGELGVLEWKGVWGFSPYVTVICHMLLHMLCD